MGRWTESDRGVILHGKDALSHKTAIAAHNADCDAYESKIAELQRRLDAVVAMLEVPTKSQYKHGWLAYCEECWWRGEADDAKWDIDLDSDGYCPECGKVILEMVGDWSREKSIHARAVAIAEGKSE